MPAKIKDFRVKINEVQVLCTWSTKECERSGLKTIRGIIHLMKMMHGQHFLNIHDLSLLEENENESLA
jgi:hypothetical protein